MDKSRVKALKSIAKDLVEGDDAPLAGISSPIVISKSYRNGIESYLVSRFPGLTDPEIRLVLAEALKLDSKGKYTYYLDADDSVVMAQDGVVFTKK